MSLVLSRSSRSPLSAIQQRRPARLPDLQGQMEPLLRQFSALLSHPVPSAVGVLGPDQTYERLNLATYDVARSLLQDAPPGLQTNPAALEGWVRRKAAQAAQHQKLAGAEADAFVDVVTELVCRNPSLLQQVAL
ncbi:MAG: hypothetical protein HY328_00890 [Chloroflexi bacterium]|nr:hypothetical protein [Chloroflexota bacterium]